MFMTNGIRGLASRKFGSWLIGLCGVWILFSSAFDAFLAYHYRMVIFVTEKNPACLFLMRFEPEHLSVFLAAKAFMTLVVLLTTFSIFRRRQWMGLTVGLALSIFQIGLLLFQFIS